MDTVRTERRRTIRDLIIFVIAMTLLSWMGWFVAREGTQEAVGLGNLIWLGAPLLVSLVLHLFSKDRIGFGIYPGFKGNGIWYAFSLLTFPSFVGLVLLAGISLGSISMTGFRFDTFGQAILAAFFSFTLVKNILEEFAWRGYLTPRVNSVVTQPLAGHLLVGLIWGTWHIPYYLALVDRQQLTAYTSFDLLTFIPLVILGTAVAGILFGELRLLTGSTWPGVLMHTMSNIITLTILVDGYATISAHSEILFTPGWHGILSICLIGLAGLWLYRARLKTQRD